MVDDCDIFAVMPKENTYIKKNVPFLYRQNIINVMIYTFIDAQRFTLPSISVDESAKAFLLHYDIDEAELPLATIRDIFFRTQKELINEQKSDNQKTA